MCGIVGIASTSGLTSSDRSAIDRMLGRLVHRGPDDEGKYVGDQAALGHRRLSIIDLRTGRQPLANEAQTVWAAANGEIYNFHDLRRELIARGHRFISETDSECLVHLYEERGEGCVERLSGMFAFAIWDDRRRRLLLARDRLGVKPLYYFCDGRRLVFASELKAVLAAPGVSADVDPTALADYLTYGFIPSPKTIFKSVHKLPPGCLLVFEGGRLMIRSYWRLEHRGWTDAPLDELADELWSQLSAATRRRLIADVPIGAFLSGGLDSTAVVACMSGQGAGQAGTLTCGFDEAGFDERIWAAAAAAILGASHREVTARPDAAEVCDRLIHHFDEPFADGSAIPMFHLCEAARGHAKVMLSGDGGDEVLAGYRRYRFDRYEQNVRRLVPAMVRRAVFSPIASVFPRRAWIPRTLRAGATLRNIAADAATAHGLSIATLPPSAAAALLSADVAEACRGYDPLDHVRVAYRDCDVPDLLSKCQYVDIRLGLSDGILTKVDRASMAWGVEVRSPMLDYEFVQFAWSIPPPWRIRGRRGKFPLRAAMRRHVGDWSASREKKGFDVPMDEWFRGPLRDRAEDTFLSPNAASGPWVSIESSRGILDRHLSGRENNGATLWKLMMFEAWCRQYLGADASSFEPSTLRTIADASSRASCTH